MPIETLILGLFTSVLGSHLMIGLVVIAFLALFCAISGIDLSGYLIALLPVIFVMSGKGSMPLALQYVVGLSCGVVCYLAFTRLMNR